MCRGSADDMTSPILLTASLGGGLRKCPREQCPEVCPAKEGVDIVHTYVCFVGGPRGPESDPRFGAKCRVRMPLPGASGSQASSRLPPACLVTLVFRDAEVSRHNVEEDTSGFSAGKSKPRLPRSENPFRHGSMPVLQPCQAFGILRGSAGMLTSSDTSRCDWQCF